MHLRSRWTDKSNFLRATSSSSNSKTKKWFSTVKLKRKDKSGFDNSLVLLTHTKIKCCWRFQHSTLKPLQTSNNGTSSHLQSLSLFCSLTNLRHWATAMSKSLGLSRKRLAIVCFTIRKTTMRFSVRLFSAIICSVYRRRNSLSSQKLNSATRSAGIRAVSGITDLS